MVWNIRGMILAIGEMSNRPGQVAEGHRRGAQDQERLRTRQGALHRVLECPRRIARYSPRYARGGDCMARIGYRL